MFLFLSGFGLYYSGLKKASPLQFYAKRAKRIFPPFWLIWFLTLLDWNKLHWADFLWGGSTLAFWISSLNKYSFGWFVSLIVALYVVFPYYFRCFKKLPLLATSLGIAVGLLLSGLYVYHFQVICPGKQNRLILPAARLPIFFIGVYAGHWLRPEHLADVKNKLRIKTFLVVLSAASIALFITALNALGFRGMRNTGLLYLLFIPILPGALTAMVEIFRCLERIMLGRIALHLLRLLGQGTLEAYLLIGLTYRYVNKTSALLHVSPLTASFLVMLATILLALLIHFAVTRFVDWISALPKTIRERTKKKANPRTTNI